MKNPVGCTISHPSLLGYHVGQTINYPCLCSPTLWAGLTTTHLFFTLPISHTINQVSHQSTTHLAALLIKLHPVSSTVSHPSLPPTALIELVTNHTYPGGCTISHPSLSSSTCQPDCQPPMSLLTHRVSCTVSHPPLYCPTMLAKLSTTHTHAVSCTVNHPPP